MDLNDNGKRSRLCYAPASQIPHHPHDWYWPDRNAVATDPLSVEAWHCDGWAALLPRITEHLQKEAT